MTTQKKKEITREFLFEMQKQFISESVRNKLIKLPKKKKKLKKIAKEISRYANIASATIISLWTINPPQVSDPLSKIDLKFTDEPTTEDKKDF